MNTIKRIFIFFTGHTYSNMSRLFLRMFVGIMFMQFGLNLVMGELPQHLTDNSTLSTCLAVLEILCAAMIIVGFLTRVAAVGGIAYTIGAMRYLTAGTPITEIPGGGETAMLLLPMMFIGIFVYFLLAGPGKVSLDYLISLRLVNRDRDDEGEATIDKA